MDQKTAQEGFLSELRRVLRALYDPCELRRSPLIALFGLENDANPPAALRRILTEGITALKPEDDVPPYAPAWRIYHVLTYSYVEQSSQDTVASNLGLSTRQLRRQERLAESALADHLWAHHHLGQAPARLQALASGSEAASEGAAGMAGNGSPGNEGELAWLRRSLANETVDVAEVIRTALKTVAPLAQRARVSVACEELEDLPPVAGPLSAVRQALLNLLTAAIHSAPGGRVQVSVVEDAQGLGVNVRAATQASLVPEAHSCVDDNLAMARQLIALFGGSLETPVAASDEAVTLRETLSTLLRLSVAERVPVLAIDDNADTLQLLERYLSGSRYQLIGTREPEEALALAEQFAPEAILLDVMLPGIDGWELLGRLREHPQTGAVPVVVCTILPQEQLALALGAAAFIRKPLSREGLLRVLDQQIQAEDWPAPGSS